MTRNHWQHIIPALLLAIGIIVSTAIVVVFGKSSQWLGVGGFILLALAVVQADAWRSRLQGRPMRPSIAALLLGGAFAVAALVMMPISAQDMASFIPVFGISAWIVLYPPPRTSKRGSCWIH